MSDIKKKYNDNKLKSGASEVIPKYAKALKLLKAKGDKTPTAIKSLTVGIRAKETIDTREDLLHTNYVERVNHWYLSTTDLYKRTVVDNLPVKFIDDKRFPIVPFGNKEVSAELAQRLGKEKINTLDAFSMLFPSNFNYFDLGSKIEAATMRMTSAESSSIVFSGDISSNAPERIEINADKLARILAMEKFKDSDAYQNIIYIKKEDLDNAVRNNSGNYVFVSSIDDFGNVPSPTHGQKRTRTCWAFSFTRQKPSGDPDTSKFGRTTETQEYDNITKKWSESTYDEIQSISNNSENLTIVLRRTKDRLADVKKTVSFNGGALNKNDNERIVINYGENYTNVTYKPAEIKESINESVDGDYYTGVTVAPPTELSGSEINAYLEASVEPNNENKDKLSYFQTLITEIIENLNEYNSKDINYYLSITDNINGIGDIEKKDNFDFVISLQNEVEKKNAIVLTERKGCNDAQFVEVPIYQRISDDNLFSEIFQIFKIQRKETYSNMSVEDIMLYKSRLGFFAENAIISTSDEITRAYNSSFNKKGIFSVNAFYSNLFKVEENFGSKQYYTLSGTRIYNYDRDEGEYKKVLGFIKTKTWVPKWVHYVSKTPISKQEVAMIKSAKGTYKATYEVPAGEYVAVPTIEGDQYTIKNVLENYTKYKIDGGAENTISSNSITSASHLIEYSFDESTNITKYQLEKKALFGFIDYYQNRLDMCFDGYEKPIVSLSLFDILTNNTDGTDDITRKYYFTAIKTEDEKPILSSGMSTLYLEDTALKNNAENMNSFFLKGNGIYKPKYIITNDSVLNSLVSIDEDSDKSSE